MILARCSLPPCFPKSTRIHQKSMPRCLSIFNLSRRDGSRGGRGVQDWIGVFPRRHVFSSSFFHVSERVWTPDRICYTPLISYRLLMVYTDQLFNKKPGPSPREVPWIATASKSQSFVDLSPNFSIPFRFIVSIKFWIFVPILLVLFPFIIILIIIVIFNWLIIFIIIGILIVPFS